MDWASKYVFHPLWDLKDRSVRLKTLRALNESQWLPEETLRARQWTALQRIVRYAYDNSDHYRELFDRNRIDPDIETVEEFRRIPLLTKNDVQRYADRLIARGYDRSTLVSARTGGSTGKSLQIHFDRLWQERRVADAQRADQWAGWDLGMKIAAIWGNPPVARTWREKVRSALLERTIYLDTMDLSDETMGAFVERYRRYGPQLVFGHAHSIFMFAKYLHAQGIADLRPKGIVATSMMLIESERAFIEAVFGCRVTNRYGCEEVGLIACECEQHNGMHLNIEHLFIEFLAEDGRAAGPGEEGQIVVTDLFNRGMPIIRYRIEDVGRLSARKCVCGRGSPLIERVTGRTADFLVRKDGSLVAGVSLVERTLTAIAGIEQMQIVQHRVDELQLNLVTNKAYDDRSEAALTTEFANVFGKDVKIRLSYGDRLPQEQSGKYRFAICKV